MLSSSFMPSHSSDVHCDSNVLLTDLDKGLRSSSVGEQCEAIVRFPALFQRYPFPILINSAALKLSEVYRTGSNYLRIFVLQVMRESEKHLDKILNIDDFVRNLFAVSYSNDPYARAITLRTLGHIARIVSGHKNITHFIRNSLDSNDELEVSAAIEASVRFAVVSKEFAENIYPKVISMIDTLATSMKTRTQLLEVVNNSHHNFTIAEDARKRLIGFLSKYPEERFVCDDLHTLTSIATTSMTNISEQVTLLLTYYSHEDRHNVCLSALHDLKLLAHKCAYLWEPENVVDLWQTFVVKFQQSTFPQLSKENDLNLLQLLCESFEVLGKLLESPSIFVNDRLIQSSQLAEIIAHCTQIIHNFGTLKVRKVDFILVSKCFIVLTNICLNCDSELRGQVLSETCCTFESFFLMNYDNTTSTRKILVGESQQAMQMIFHSMVRLARAFESNPSTVLPLTEALRFLFLNLSPKSAWNSMICESACALSYLIKQNQSITSNDVLSVLKSRYGERSSKSKINENDAIALKLFVLYFQLQCGEIIKEVDYKQMAKLLNGIDLWFCFKVVREAMRYGHHNVASRLLYHLDRSMEPTENTYIFINCLQHITKGESTLMEPKFYDIKHKDFLRINYDEKQFDELLTKAIQAYIEGLLYLNAAVTTSNPMYFRIEFIKLRMKYLQAHLHFRHYCNLLQSSPPPIAAMSSGTNMGDELLKCGRIVSSMRLCAQQFRTLAEGYSGLYQSSFNADNNSLTNIQLLQHNCTILAEVIENLFQSNHRINSLFVPSRSNGDDAKMDKVYQQSDSPSSNNNNSNYIAGGDNHTIIEHKELQQMYTLISNLVSEGKLLNVSDIESKHQEPEGNNNGNKFFAVFTTQIAYLLRVSTRLLSVPLSLPRFFFQPAQTTTIKLELSPQPKNNQEHIILYQNVQFVLNVEGIIVNDHSALNDGLSNGSKSSITSTISLQSFDVNYASSAASLVNFQSEDNTNQESKIIRKVNKIMLSLTANQTEGGNGSAAFLASVQPITMHSIVSPLNDYFQTQFLLTLSSPGVHCLTVEASVIDDNEAQWKTGPMQSITAKVMEDFTFNKNM